ncbi:hypothetical protein [Kitasatospora sp. NPDC091207]|uniref:hypothetical protein n=1 Tax=Kitasatospora sp. NPDC091207 TaxID=3364083 RepID=UPI0038191006
MGGDGAGTVLGVVIAVTGVIGSVLVARVSTPRRSLESTAPSEVPQVPGHDELQASPEIWQHFSGRISGLESKVDHLTDLVEQQTERVTTLTQLVRMAMRIVRQQSRTLRRSGLQDEPVPDVLIPYSIE